MREVLRDAGRPGGQPEADLGSRIAERFRGLGLAEEITELRGHPARGADFDEL